MFNPTDRRVVAIALLAALLGGGRALGQAPSEWPQHSMERPKPPVVDPGPFTRSPPPPSDAIVLFDGGSLMQWRKADTVEATAGWKVENGYMEVVAGAGGVETVRTFGDGQLHIEWMSPSRPQGEGQNRGNSGIFFMGRYEVQVLDSHHNETYADGQAASIYGQFPPLVNASRVPGEWQGYDIVFRRPRFDAAGKLIRPARITLFHNGILVQDAVELLGPTSNQRRAPYEAHPDKLPIMLQDHGHPVRFRNIWFRAFD